MSEILSLMSWILSLTIGRTINVDTFQGSQGCKVGELKWRKCSLHLEEYTSIDREGCKQGEEGEKEKTTVAHG